MGCFFFLFISNFSATNMLYSCSFYKRGKSLKQKKIGGPHNTCGEDVIYDANLPFSAFGRRGEIKEEKS